MPHQMTYQEPARQWVEALPLGNGKLGAMVYGNPSCERFCLNDEGLWSGCPVMEQNPEAKGVLPELRAAIRAKDFVQAETLAHQMQGPETASYQPLGDLLIQSSYQGASTRSLDLRTAVHEVAGNTLKVRSFINDVLVVSYQSDEPLDFVLALSTPHAYSKSELSEQTIRLYGRGPQACPTSNEVDPSLYAKTDAEALAPLFDLALEFTTDGEVTKTRWKPEMAPALDFYSEGKTEDYVQGENLQAYTIKGATTLNLSLASAVGLPWTKHRPDPQPGEPLYIADPASAAACRKRLEEEVMSKLQHASLKPSTKHQQCYARCSLDLQNEIEVPHDLKERILQHEPEDHALCALFFNYARYLLLAGSAEDANYPLTLSGIWNPLLAPPWRSNFTININTEMNYWPAEPLALGETTEPLFRHLERLMERGKETAKTYYGLPGWTAHHNTDAWAQTAPVGAFGHASPSWAMWPMGGAWLALQCIERLRYRPTEEAKQRLYPILKGVCDFLAAWVEEDGWTIPATSPENQFIVDETAVSVSYNAAMDHALITELLRSFMSFYGTVERYQAALDRLFDLQILPDGRLAEWGEEHVEEDPHHRHLSHLLGVYPGRSITEQIPELFQAHRRSLEVRGDEATGWGMAWRIALWARFGEAQRAQAILTNLLRPAFDATGKAVNRMGSVYPNLFDAHPPFQIDGNFGAAAAIAEFFVQNEGDDLRTLHLGKAIPPKWTGTIHGLRATWGTTVDLEFSQGTITKATIRNKVSLNLKIHGNLQVLCLTPGVHQLEQSLPDAYNLV